MQNSQEMFIKDWVRRSCDPWKLQNKVVRTLRTHVLTATKNGMDAPNVNGMQARKTGMWVCLKTSYLKA
jgi:hypothetical protein